MNNNLDGAQNQNITGAKCQTSTSTTTANAAAASRSTAATSLTATASATALTSLSTTPIIIKSTSDSECTIIRSSERTSDPNISNFFRKLSSGLDATEGSTTTVPLLQQPNVKIGDSIGVPDSSDGSSGCVGNGVIGGESVDGEKQQPYMSSGCFAHRRQSYCNSGAKDVSNLSESELREIIRELTNKMEYTERMNWLCKYLFEPSSPPIPLSYRVRS